MLLEEEKKAIEQLKSFNDGFTFKECEVCSNHNEQDHCCNKEKCDNLKVIDMVLNIIKRLKKENKEKDKQMNLMIEKINQAYCQENNFWNWFEESFGIKPDGDYTEEIKQYFNEVKL